MQILKWIRFTSCTCVIAVFAFTVCAEDSPGPGEPSRNGGFINIFDGTTLNGWCAVPEDTAVDWEVLDGVIVGKGIADHMSYLVWEDGDLTDFELELSYRLLGEGNTGIEIRARPDATGKRPFEGYHADLGHVGIGDIILGAWDFHFGKGRRKEPPCPRGTRLLIDEQGKWHSSAFPDPIELGEIRRQEWNRVRVIATGNRFQFFINDKMASEFTDNASEGRLTRGAIGLQVHDKGMHVEFKDIRLRRLDDDTPGSRSAGEALSDEPERSKNLGLQYPENPPMELITKTPPEPMVNPEDFEIRDGFTLVESLEDFRVVIKQDNQKIRMKPDIYRAETCDPPSDGQAHIFAVTGSDNHFDLRGVVFETPVSVQSTLPRKGHMSDTWHINGANNTFEGGYFCNIIDRPYPEYRVTENEFEVRGDGNTFLNCTFFITGSVPYGYTDYYGKGGPNFGRLNKHSFMSLHHVNDTTLIGCQVYMQSFGHCVHFHTVDGVLVKDCFFTGTLRPTNDIFKETVGRAVKYDFQIMYRGERPIPRDQMIPLTEDGVRSYDKDKNITVVNTTVERLRGCFQLLCDGDITLENVTVREAGDFCYDLSAGDKGTVVMTNCRSDLAYSPVFNLTRGPVPKDAFYEVTILNPPEGTTPTARTSLGTICGENCTFVLHDGTTTPLPEEHNVLRCGGGFRENQGLTNSTVTNYTAAKVILDEHVRNCTINSVGPVEDHGKGNTITQIEPETFAAAR